MKSPPVRERLMRNALRQFGRSFEGGALDNCAGAPMGKGHKNDGQPFNIETACYLKPKFDEYDRAIRSGTRLEMVDLSGVKTVKSFVMEMCAADFICHRTGDAAIFFGSETAAESTVTTRMLDSFRNIPNFREKMRTFRTRFDETQGALKFPDKTLFMLSANLANTAQKNLGFVGVQDCYVLKSNGMIDEAVARTTQYEQEAIIWLESQGCDKSEDFARRYRKTDQRELHVRCPICGRAHIFNWKAFDEQWMTRADDFAPTPPLAVPSLDREAWIAHHRPILLSAERRVAGFRRGPDSIIKRADGDYIEAAVIRETHFECYHCGGIWRDDFTGTDEGCPLRIALDRSSHYVASRADALPWRIGFNTPQWINRRLSWGQMMLEKLTAQRDANESGNWGPLKVWWAKTAARIWDSDINSKSVERPDASVYDVMETIPGEKRRISATDIQFHLTHMVYLAVAVGDGVPPRVLHYEWIKPPSGLTDAEAARHCKNRVRELDKEFKIAIVDSMKDAAHEPGLVREWAAEDAVFGPMRNTAGRVKRQWITYGLLMGDDRVSYKWTHPGRRDTWERFKQFQFVNVEAIKDGRRVTIPVHHRLWSNPSIKDIAERWRDGRNAPKLQIHSDFLADTSKDGLWAQLNSERKMPWKGHPGKERYDNENRPNHYWDCWNMIVVRMDELGYLNSFGAPPQDEEE